MTAPELVDVVAGVIREHVLDWQFDGNRGRLECDCGAEVIAGDGAAHQARAVLDALAKAGEVEWGVRWGDGTHVWTRKSLPSSRNQIEAGGGVLVSRLTFPWTAVE